MSKLVRVEDIVKVVGMKNYIASLEMLETNLSYRGYQLNEKKEAVLEFLYSAKEKAIVHITIDKKRNIKAIQCDCEHFNQDVYCPHVALAIKYLFSDETLVNHLIQRLNKEQDDGFNRLLFMAMKEEKIKKPLRISLGLKQIDRYEPFIYELQVRVGDRKEYLLKRQLEEFITSYGREDVVIPIGKEFTYDSKEYTVAKQDEPVMEFLKMYVDSQMTSKAFYTYARREISSITISKSTLSHVLGLCKNRKFYVDQLGKKTVCDGISDQFHLDASLLDENAKVRLSMEYGDIVPLTEDYEYILSDGVCYHLGKDERKLLRLLVRNHKKTVLLTEQDLPSFVDHVLPKVLKFDEHMKIAPSLQDRFQIGKWVPRLYFEKRKKEIVAHIHLKDHKEEFDIYKKDENRYYVYSHRMVEEIESLLVHYGFRRVKDEFVLKDEEAVIYFIERGMYVISEQYDTMIESSLKKMKVNRKTKVESSFRIGQDRILNYEFQLEGVGQEDFSNVLEALAKKKKYVQLKSGDYLDLEQEALEEFDQVYQSLGFSNYDPKGKLPIYECVRLLEMGRHRLGTLSLDDSVEKYMEEFKTYKDQKVKFTKEESILRDYQMTGVKWMLMIAHLGFGGILADEMGLGKSLQTIVYIKHRLKEDPKRKFLIVVPTSLVYNWQNEWEKFAPHIHYEVIHETKEKRQKKLEHLEDCQVVITSYGTLRNDIDFYRDICFDTCLIDEAQSIKNVGSETTMAVKQVVANTKFALTGTPIENSVLELWSIFDYLMPGFLGDLPSFKERYQIKNLEESAEALDELRSLISPFILRRRKCDVLKDLPAKIENNVYVELSDEQKALYVQTLEETKLKIEEAVADSGFQKNQFLILSLLMKLRQICIDPRLLFEGGCIGSKMETVIDLVSQIKENGHKILLFSQFPSALKLLIPKLEKKGISYAYLDGQTKSKERMRLVENFQKNDETVFLISLKAGGTGLNLTSADVVIHLDPWWNPQVENQATDRSHRIGQKNVVEVIKLITKGTIEERIVELQRRKSELSARLIDQGSETADTMLTKLSEEDLWSLLGGTESKF